MQEQALRCVPCAKVFSGKGNLNDHLKSVKHLKKTGEFELLLASRSSGDAVCTNPKDLVTSDNDCPENVTVMESENPIGPESQQSRLYCQVCKLQCNSGQQYEQHIVGDSHLKKAKRVMQVEVKPQITSSHNIVNEASSAIAVGHHGAMNTLKAYRCDACDANFTGSVPYEQHNASKRHKKKILQSSIVHSSFEDSSESMLPSNNQELQQITCHVCLIQCTGIVSYQQHVKSYKHAEMVEQNNSSKGSSGDSSTDLSTVKCSLCNKMFTGDIPYKQHIESKAHKKKVEMVKNVEERMSKRLPFDSDGSSSVDTCSGSSSTLDISDEKGTKDKMDYGDSSIRTVLDSGESPFKIAKLYIVDDLKIKIFKPDEEVTFVNPDEMDVDMGNKC